MRKICALILLVAIGHVAHAERSEYLPAAKLKLEDVSRWNAGAGITQKLVHANLEWINPYGVAYAKLGAFYNDDHELGGQLGFRYPAILTGKDLNGYYVGAFAGHLRSKVIDAQDKAQLGGGVDLALVFMNKERISTLSVGIVAGEKMKQNNVVVYETKPELQFAYSLSIGF